MLTGNECRAKAAYALMRQAEATDPVVQAIFETHVREWKALAVTADFQTELEARLN